MKTRFAWAQGKNFQSSKFILFGVPDESGSKAYRKGTMYGPNQIRKISTERGVFSHRTKFSLVQPQLNQFDSESLYDMGNITRGDIYSVVRKIFNADKFPVIIGGDHSITFEVLRALDQEQTPISLVYLDAHPDIVCSERRYYGSVICDVSELKKINLRRSIIIGVRAAEIEELENIRRYNLQCITPLEMMEMGISTFVNNLEKLLLDRVYLSIDLDVIDPAFSPGVSTPEPAGLSSMEVIYLCKKIAEKGLIGFDITQLSPPQDIQDKTSHLAAKLLIEVLS